jgi:hypothetical protein
MIKTGRAKRKAQTHFEQVPLEVVKKLLDGEAVKTDRAGTNNLIVETAAGKTERYSLAARSTKLLDPKLSQVMVQMLVHQRRPLIRR